MTTDKTKKRRKPWGVWVTNVGFAKRLIPCGKTELGENKYYAPSISATKIKKNAKWFYIKNDIEAVNKSTE